MIELSEGDDCEMCELVEFEFFELCDVCEWIWNEFLEMIIGGDDVNCGCCVMEVCVGMGGDEVVLFVCDFYEMYKWYCEIKGWKVEIFEYFLIEFGGFKEI